MIDIVCIKQFGCELDQSHFEKGHDIISYVSTSCEHFDYVFLYLHKHITVDWQKCMCFSFA